MALQFTSVEEPSFSRGIDARSAENQIRDGFVRDLVNGDIVEGRIKKRKGYESFAGNIPLRVVTYRQPEAGKAIVSLDSSIDLSRVEGRPILLYGRTSSSHASPNPFTSTEDRTWWFTDWETNLRKYFNVGSGSITATAVEHSIPSTDMYVGVSENVGYSPSVDTLSGELLTTSIDVDNSTRLVTVNYTNGRAADVPVFLYYLDRTTVDGTTYSQSDITPISVDDTHTFNIPASVHGLSTSNILYQLYQYHSVNGKWIQCFPDSFTCSSIGDITYSVTADSGVTFRIVLSSVSDSQVVEGGESITLVNQPNSYLFYTCYNGVNEIKPDTVQYDDDEKTVVFTFSGEEVPNDIRICYEYGVIRTNEIYLDDADIGAGPDSIPNPSFASTFTDSVPQLTLYGISHDIAYGDNKRNFRRGWVNHIDSYRSPDNVHMVAGLGGNLYAALDAGMPTYYPDLRVRSVGEQYIGPAFGLSSSDRSRGVYSFTGSGSGWAKVTKAKWSTGGIEYTLETPNRTSTSASPVEEGDYLTLKGMPFSRHNGTFKVTVVDDSDSDKLIITVDNPNVPNNDYNDEGCSGSGGIFSDRFSSISVYDTRNPFLPGDRLLSSSWGNETELYVSAYNLNVDSGQTTPSGEVIYISDNTVHVTGCYDIVRLGSNLLITGERTSDTVRFRTVANVPQVDYLVPGDTVTYSEQDNLLQIVSVDTDEHTVTFDSSITWRDSVTLAPTFTVAHRWLPVEAPAPDAGDTLIPSTSVRYFTSDDYDNQSFLRSAMVQNNLYLTNGKDEVYKYDGTHNYRAGIIPWQPGLFLTAESIASGGIPLVGFSPITVDALAGDKLQVSKTNSSAFRVGDIYAFTNASGFRQYLTLEENIERDTSSHYLKFKEPLQFTTLGTTPVLSSVYVARYYFRLNIRDVNGVVTASAVTGAEDFVSFINPTTALQYRVNLRLVGLPAWDQYDFRNKNIEVEVYRTLWTTTAVGETPVFFRLPQTKVSTFTGTDGYIDIIDTYSNDVLQSPDLVVGALSPNTIPAAWDEPPRAKYVTTAGNRLVLANLTDWPTLSLSYLAKSAIDESAFNSQRILFKRDITASGSTTDMVNRVGYELRSSGQVLAALVSSSAGNSFVFSAAAPRAIQVKDWVYIDFKTTGVDGLTYNGWWQVAEQASSAATTTVGAQNNVTTLNVVSTAGFLSAGSFVRSSVTYTYTGITATSFTGISPNITVAGGDSITSTAPAFRVSTTLATGSIPSGITYPISAVFASSAFDVPVWLGADYNMGMFNGQVVGFNAPEIRVIRRLGMAINATMRMTNTALGGQESFKPWIIARSESDTYGQLVVKQPRVENTALGLLITTAATSANLTTYVNGSLVADLNVPTTAAVTRYPSRIAASYDNYPEIFDNLWTNNPDESDSILDINSSDGQEITGIIPFFGDSAFGAAQQSSVLVVFKQNSIYLVDLAAKVAGQNAVQRLQTQGLGCTAPYSIAPTRNGIAFANESGVYVLRTNQTIEYLGRYMERNWQEKVDLGALSIAQGHHFGVGRQYKLSVPMAASSSSSYAENEEVYVYNHTGEADGELGGWSRYTNHPVTGWANLFQNAFLATANGSVMRVRSSGGVSDYRDANVAVESILEARAVSFGNTSIRKAVANLVVHYRSGANSENTFVYTSPDLYNEYQLSTLFKVVTKSIQDGLSSTGGQAVVSIMHTFGRRRCIYMSVKITNNGLDENVEIAGMSYIVAGLSGAGVKQAAETT